MYLDNNYGIFLDNQANFWAIYFGPVLVWDHIWQCLGDTPSSMVKGHFQQSSVHGNWTMSAAYKIALHHVLQVPIVLSEAIIATWKGIVRRSKTAELCKLEISVCWSRFPSLQCFLLSQLPACSYSCQPRENLMLLPEQYHWKAESIVPLLRSPLQPPSGQRRVWLLFRHLIQLLVLFPTLGCIFFTLCHK